MQQKHVQILAGALFLALLGFGIFELLLYVGQPIHMLVLVKDSVRGSMIDACIDSPIADALKRGEVPSLPWNDAICLGSRGFFSFILYTLTKAQVFLPYVVVSLIGYGFFLGFRFARDGRWPDGFHLRPWHLVTLFLFSLWLIFTVLSGMKTGSDTTIRRVFEPLPQIYKNVGEEELQELQANFADLKRRRCLTYVAETQSGASAYTLKISCMQSAFLTRVFSQVLFIIALLFELLVLGRATLSALRLRPKTLLLESLFSAGAGACAFVALFWLLAVFDVFTGFVGWSIFLLVPFIFFRHALRWIRVFLFHTWHVRMSWYDVRILLLWLLLSYLALNFLQVVRPFPIGWDDLSSYLNRPRLLVSYGSFVYSMAPFQWEYLSALGFLLFGYESVFGATASMMINWMAGLLAVCAIFVFVRTYMGPGRGVLAALLYYSLPLVGHFSFADMKVDNAVFTMGTLCLFAIFMGLFPPATEDGEPVAEPDRQWFLLAGALGGFALAMKPTAAMVVAAGGVLLLGGGLSFVSFFGSVFLAFMVFAAKGVFNIPNITRRIFGDAFGKWAFVSFFAVMGLAGVSYALYHNREKMRPWLASLGLFAGGFLFAVSPWLIHNNYLLGNVIPSFEMGAPNVTSPSFLLFPDRVQVTDYGQDIRELPGDLALNPDHQTCSPTGAAEELDRYWGYDQGWRHYLTLPWRAVMNMNATGYYVTTMPALLLFPLLLLLPFFWSKRGRWLRWLFAATVFLILEWMFMANGIPWYGIGMFFGLVVGLEAFVARAPDIPNRVLASVLIAASLFVSFSNRFWQFDTTRNMLEYPIGEISAATLQERTIPYYDNIAAIAVDRHTSVPDRPYLYRVGTFIPYFIPKNLEIIGLADHQLDTFNCLYQERNAELTLRRLKALGFNSIVFDTNTPTIEPDPQGSLHQKVKAFEVFLNEVLPQIQVKIFDEKAGIIFVLIP